MNHQFRVVSCSLDDSGIAPTDVLVVLAAVAPAFFLAAGTGLAVIVAIAAWALLWPLDRSERADTAHRIAVAIKAMIIGSGAYAGARLMHLAVERDLTPLMIGATTSSPDRRQGLLAIPRTVAAAHACAHGDAQTWVVPSNTRPGS